MNIRNSVTCVKIKCHILFIEKKSQKKKKYKIK